MERDTGGRLTVERDAESRPAAERDADGGRSVEFLYDILFRTSREAHALGQHEVAYHALAAAMHAAKDARDARGLTAVQREAAAQIDWIDRNVPHHRLSTASAGARRHSGVYPMLEQQTAAHLQMVEGGAPAPAGDRPPGPVE